MVSDFNRYRSTATHRVLLRSHKIQSITLIYIRYHFIKYQVLNGNIELIFGTIDDAIVYVFTKALDETKFNSFRKNANDAT